MSQSFPISNPARFATPTAVGFTDGTGALALVSQGAPLPVILTNPGSFPNLPAAAPPLQGQRTSSAVVGPFKPAGGTPIHLQLSGDWSGRVSLERSTDDGATRQGLTVGGRRWASFTGNANEPVWQDSEAGATFWLDIQITTGELTYRVSQ